MFFWQNTMEPSMTHPATGALPSKQVWMSEGQKPNLSTLH
jgi:hypothetical protein